MRRLLATLTVLFACLLGLPTAQATTHPGGHPTGQLAPRPLGGGALLVGQTSTVRCTAAFAAVAGSSWYLIADRGCAAATSTQLYSPDLTLIGTVVSANPAYTVVHVTNTTDWQLVPWIDTGLGRVVIGGSVETPVGGTVCVIDRATGTQCGTVVAKNQTVTFPGGTVTGLTRTNVCASRWAIAYLSGDQAQGVPVGGTANCTIGGSSWFTPVNRILRTYGLTLLTG